MNKIKGCKSYPTKLVVKAAQGGIMTKPQPTSTAGVQPYAMPVQATNTLAQQRAQTAKDNYASMASDYMARAQARRSAPAAPAAAPYQKMDLAALQAKYGINQPKPAAAPRAASAPTPRDGPAQGSAASRNTKYDTYSTKADTTARAMSYGPQPKQKGYTGLKDMVDGGGPGASKGNKKK